MAVLMIKCPRTGQDMSPGILTDSGSYQRIPDTLAYTRCPHWGLGRDARSGAVELTCCDPRWFRLQP